MASVTRALQGWGWIGATGRPLDNVAIRFTLRCDASCLLACFNRRRYFLESSLYSWNAVTFVLLKFSFNDLSSARAAKRPPRCVAIMKFFTYVLNSSTAKLVSAYPLGS